MTTTTTPPPPALDLGLRLRRGELPFQVLADETIVVHPRTHEVHVLNDTGGAVWALLETERSVGEILGLLVEEFDGPEAVVREEAARFLGELVDRKILLARAPAGAGGA